MRSARVLRRGLAVRTSAARGSGGRWGAASRHQAPLGAGRCCRAAAKAVTMQAWSAPPRGGWLVPGLASERSLRKWGRHGSRQGACFPCSSRPGNSTGARCICFSGSGYAGDGAGSASIKANAGTECGQQKAQEKTEGGGAGSARNRACRLREGRAASWTARKRLGVAPSAIQAFFRKTDLRMKLP